MNQATISIPFAIGENLWHAAPDPDAQWEVCDTCFGTLKVTMVLGNGEKHVLNCAACRLGYGQPSGRIQTHRYRYTPKEFIPTNVSMSGDEFHYSRDESGQFAYATTLTRDRAECQVMCDEMNAKHAAEEHGRCVANRTSKRRDMVWAVGYWRGQLRKAEADVARLREHLGIVIEHKKSKP